MVQISRESWMYAAARWMYRPVRTTVEKIGRMIAVKNDRRRVRRYLSRDGFKGLQVGCGPHRLEAWLNSDLLENPHRDIFIDVTRTLPLPDNSLDAVYASEVIEHVAERDARRFFGEARRVLKPGGVLRLTTPDLAAICGLYLGVNEVATIDQFGTIWRGGIFTPDRWVNAQFRAHGHQFIWSHESLSAALREAGFDGMLRCAPRTTRSKMLQLAQLERHYSEREPTWVFARTLIVEAVKPAADGSIATIQMRGATRMDERRRNHLERLGAIDEPAPVWEAGMFI